MNKKILLALVSYVVMDRHMEQWFSTCRSITVVLQALTKNEESRMLRERITSIIDTRRKAFLDRLLNDMSEVRVVSQIRMNIGTFRVLCDMLRSDGGLTDNGRVTIEEQVVMFLYILAHHHNNSVLVTTPLWSGETVSKCFHKVLNACVKLHKTLLENPKIVEGNNFDTKWKWFQGCIGALDGNFLDVRVSDIDKPRYRNRKGHLATNVLGVCSQNMNFIFVLPGWEGSASNPRVLRDAISRPNGLRVPNGNYYLVDAGYTNARGFLAPYRGTRYHLNEWRPGMIPNNKEELFNLRHASTRNVLERCFGVLKQRWAILRSATCYPLKTYNRIVICCCLLHKLIRREMAMDYAEDEYEDYLASLNNVVGNGDEDVISTVESSTEWTEFRDTLAQEINNVVGNGDEDVISTVESSTEWTKFRDTLAQEMKNVVGNGDEDVISTVEPSTEWTKFRDTLAQEMYNEWVASRLNNGVIS